MGEAGDTGEVVHDLRDEVALLEEALSQMGTSSKMLFHLTLHSRLPSQLSLSPEHWQSKPAHEDQMCYCIYIRATLWGGGGDQAPPSYAWSGLFIADMFQDGLEEQITEAVVLAPGEVILFFRWQ